MSKSKTISYFFTALLLVFVLCDTSALFAQKIIPSGEQLAGFRFDDAVSAEPILEYQQDIEMLSAIDDKPSLRVFGDGRVLVHHPVYMKKAGDFEMRLSDAELVSLMRDLSSSGIMDFDEKKAKEKVKVHEDKLKAKGQFYEVSDSLKTSVNVKIDEYQVDKKSKKIKSFSSQFKWKNIEQDAARYKDALEIAKANKAIQSLNRLMNDQRLVHKEAK